MPVCWLDRKPRVLLHNLLAPTVYHAHELLSAGWTGSQGRYYTICCVPCTWLASKGLTVPLTAQSASLSTVSSHVSLVACGSAWRDGECKIVKRRGITQERRGGWKISVVPLTRSTPGRVGGYWKCCVEEVRMRSEWDLNELLNWRE